MCVCVCEVTDTSTRCIKVLVSLVPSELESSRYSVPRRPRERGTRAGKKKWGWEGERRDRISKSVGFPKPHVIIK